MLSRGLALPGRLIARAVFAVEFVLRCDQFACRVHQREHGCPHNGK